MAPEFIAFDASGERDPDGTKLRNMLSAHFRLERAHFHRVFLVHWLAVLSGPVWLAALWPGWPSPEGCRLLLLSWALSALMAGASILREWRWRVRRDWEAAGISADLPSGR